MERISDSYLFKDSDLTVHDAVSIGTILTAVPDEDTASISSAQAVREDLIICQYRCKNLKSGTS